MSEARRSSLGQALPQGRESPQAEKDQCQHGARRTPVLRVAQTVVGEDPREKGEEGNRKAIEQQDSKPRGIERRLGLATATEYCGQAGESREGDGELRDREEMLGQTLSGRLTERHSSAGRPGVYQGPSEGRPVNPPRARLVGWGPVQAEGRRTVSRSAFVEPRFRLRPFYAAVDGCDTSAERPRCSW